MLIDLLERLFGRCILLALPMALIPAHVRAQPARTPASGHSAKPDSSASCRNNPDREAAAAACVSAGSAYEMAGHMSGGPNYSAVLWYYARACSLGDGNGCMLATQLREDHPKVSPVDPDPAPRTAARLVPSSGTEASRQPQVGDAKCRNNSDRKSAAVSCLLYGSIHSTAVNAQMGPSWPTALWYFDRACSLGHREGCSRAAAIRREQPKVTAADPQVLLGPQTTGPQRRAEAVASQRTRSAREPVAPGSVLARGIALYREMDFQPALQMFLAAAKADPDDPRVYVFLARTYDWLGMSVESRMAAESARRIDPDAFSILSR